MIIMIIIQCQDHGQDPDPIQLQSSPTQSRNLTSEAYWLTKAQGRPFNLNL